ncbi:unnamed protein product [Lampetra fluviatilis]
MSRSRRWNQGRGGKQRLGAQEGEEDVEDEEVVERQWEEEDHEGVRSLPIVLSARSARCRIGTVSDVSRHELLQESRI